MEPPRKRKKVNQSVQVAPAQSRQQYGVPTYDSLFKYILDKPSLQSSFLRAFANLNVTSVRRIDDHMNPLKELEHLRNTINSKKTAR